MLSGGNADVAELTTLLIISVAYVALRARSPYPSAPSSPTSASSNAGRRSPVGVGLTNLRERPGRRGSHHAAQVVPAKLEDDGQAGIGSRGCIWGTEEREYRCVNLFRSELTTATAWTTARSSPSSSPLSLLLPCFMVR